MHLCLPCLQECVGLLIDFSAIFLVLSFVLSFVFTAKESYTFCLTCLGECLCLTFDWTKTFIIALSLFLKGQEYIFLLVWVAEESVRVCRLFVPPCWPFVLLIICFRPWSLVGEGRDCLIFYLYGIVTQNQTACHWVEQEFQFVLCRWALWHLHHRIFFWCNLTCLNERKNELQYNFYYNAFAIVLSELTISNHPLPHCQHPWKRKT